MISSVLVLLSTYNGEKYIDELILSVLNQKNCDCHLLIRDDSSTDNTMKILRKYENNYNNIHVYQGNNLGYAKSFWNLIENSGDYDYYAFCDQDDIWLPDKLCSAIKLIEENKETQKQALLYTSNVICINNDKEIIKNTSFFCNKPLNVYQSFQKSILPGCTFVFNRYSKEVLKKYNGYMESHDWATYAIISVFGKVIYDHNSYIHYRIHEQNTIGMMTKKEMLKIKIKRFFKKSKNSRSKFAKDFFDTYANDIKDKIIKKSIMQLGYYRKKMILKLKLLFNNNFKGFIFKIYVILNKV